MDWLLIPSKNRNQAPSHNQNGDFNQNTMPLATSSPTPLSLSEPSRDMIPPPSFRDFVLPLKPFRIPFLHTKDARIAVVSENDKLKRPATASSATGSSRTLGLRAEVGQNRMSVPLFQAAQLSRPSTALSQASSSSLRNASFASRPPSTSRNRSLTDTELDRIEVERKRLDERLISMKGILNDMNAQSKFMDDELKRLQFQSTMLDKDLLDCDVEAEHKLVQSLHAVQTKTEYWIQSVKEEELYTNTLTLVQDRNSNMKQEVASKSDAAQAELRHYNHDLHVLSIRLHQAKLEQAASEKALQIFSAEIASWREQREAQLAARNKQVSSFRMENSNTSKNSDTEHVSIGSDALSKRSLQDGMLQMKRLTQQETAESIAACYNNCIERTQMFHEEEEVMKNRIANCKVQKETLSKQLEILKYGGDDMDADADVQIKARTKKIEKCV
jgi:hypothetical protein